MARVELHCHLLPGLDDGAGSLHDSLEIARASVRDGAATVVATPHVRSDFVTDLRELPGLVREVRDLLAAESVWLSVAQGAELGHEMVGRLSQAELETIALGPPGARWLLLETPFERIGDELHLAADELRDRGFGVVLAHPERSAGVLAGGAAPLRRELARGTLLQVNTWSLLGGHGAAARDAAHQLLTSGLVSVLASDAHGGRRLPSLGAGVEAALAAGLAPAAAERLVSAAPAGLLERGLRPASEPIPA